jgi:hypothetical protein
MDKIYPTGGHKSQYENLFYMSVQHEKPSLLLSADVIVAENGVLIFGRVSEFWHFGSFGASWVEKWEPYT